MSNSEQNMNTENFRPPFSGEERKLTNRLLIKTVIALSAMTVVIILLAGYSVDQYHSQHSQGIMRQHINVVQEAFESIMLDSAGNEMQRVQGFFEGFGREQWFLKLRLVSNDTVIIFSKDREELGRKIDLVTDPVCSLCHGEGKQLNEREKIFELADGSRAYHFVVPIEKKPACYRCHAKVEKNQGILVGDFSLRETDLEIAHARSEIAITGLTLLLISVGLIYYLLNAFVYKPLSLTATRMARIAHGDFTWQQTRPQEDIMGFINLQLDSTAEQLRQHYEELEEMVQQRTRSLQLSQAALGLEKDKLKFIFDNSPQAIIGISEEGIILFANRKASQLAGMLEPELEGSPVENSELFKVIFDSDAVQSSLKKEIASMAVELVRQSDQQSRYYEVQTSPVRAQDNKLILLLMLVDITEARLMEESLHRRERLASIGQLAAGVGHEVGNPLSAISSLVQLSQNTEDQELLKHNLKLINMHIGRISHIVRNLSDFARMPDETAIDADLNEIVRAATEIASFDKRSKKVEININLPDKPILIRTRRDQLMQALLNVIINALDAVQEIPQPQIKISASSDEHSAIVKITDNGRGIAKDNLQKIFEPFYTTKAVGEGTGLGLSITYRIVNDIGGDLRVESRPGQGTTMSMILPIESEHE